MSIAVNFPAAVPRVRRWPSIAAVGVFLTYFIWAGSSYDPRLSDCWVNTPTGWTVPAPGLFHLSIAGTLLFAALSVLAIRVSVPLMTRRWVSITSAVILLVAAAWAHDAIYTMWRPFPLDPATLSDKWFTPVWTSWRAVGCWADVLTTALLMAILYARKAPGGIWPAALFALHPLVLWSAANGSPILCFLPPIVFLAAMSPRLKRPVIDFLIICGICACMVWFVRTPGIAPGTTGFNGLVAQALGAAGVSRGAGVGLLMGGELLLLVGIGVLAIRARWDLARAWGHLLLAWAIFSPTVLPADVVVIVALLPLAWTRAGWVLSFTVLLSYAAVFAWSPGSAWQLPAWLVYVMFVPVVVVELQELFAAGWELYGAQRPKSVARQAYLLK